MRKEKEEEKVEHLIPISIQMAQTCNHFAVLDGKLYFVANDLSSNAPVRTSENLLCREVWTLDLAHTEEGWSHAPQLKTGRCNPHTIVLSGKLYVLGDFDLKKNMHNRFPWMEVFDPIKRKWEPLPNPRFRIRSNLVFTTSLEDEDNQKILVATMSPSCEIAQIYGYVAACRWTKLLADCKMGFHLRVARPVRSIEMEYFDFGSFVTAGSTLYWASNRVEDDYICRINAFDLVNQKHYEESLHTDIKEDKEDEEE
ncbi:putative F-box/kelch-repeat protein At5g28180 [Quercus lobata]|uniref:putative F-box/kelch-repeat protein At5g28180 n=1 Tax=Quercus lobata TaxID=97700 RepID=UPI001243D937|nr:putative F-box/kelch-repeat protein At5g28180 [Quercus lobata]